MPARVSLIDCSGSPNYPAAIAGDWYTVSVAGLIGGASGEPVAIGDRIVCITGNIGGTQASVGSSWKVVNATIAGELTFAKEEAHTISVATSTTTNTAGGALSVTAGAGVGSGTGGAIATTGGAGGATGAGGAASIRGGAGGATSGAGGAATIAGGAATAGNSNGGAGSLTGGNGSGTGTGGAVGMTAGSSGAGATGDGGDVSLTGGSADSTNGNGGTVTLTVGAKAGSGFDGIIRLNGAVAVKQGTPTAKTVSATLTAAEILAGIITVNQAAGGASAQQLPTATDMDTGFPDVATGYAFDFSVINTSTVDAEDASVTTNTGWTLVGSMDIHAYSAAGSLNSSARFRARKTGSAAWTLYRIS
jgi:hypothetical protein